MAGPIRGNFRPVTTEDPKKRRGFKYSGPGLFTPYTRPVIGNGKSAGKEGIMAKLSGAVRKIISFLSPEPAAQSVATVQSVDRNLVGAVEHPENLEQQQGYIQRKQASQSATEILSDLILQRHFKESKSASFDQLGRFFEAKGTAKLSRYEYEQVAAILKRLTAPFVVGVALPVSVREDVGMDEMGTHHFQTQQVPSIAQSTVQPMQSKQSSPQHNKAILQPSRVFCGRFEYDDVMCIDYANNNGEKVFVPVPTEPKLNLKEMQSVVSKRLSKFNKPEPADHVSSAVNTLSAIREEKSEEGKKYEQLPIYTIPDVKPAVAEVKEAPKGKFDFGPATFPPFPVESKPVALNNEQPTTKLFSFGESKITDDKLSSRSAFGFAGVKPAEKPAFSFPSATGANPEERPSSTAEQKPPSFSFAEAPKPASTEPKQFRFGSLGQPAAHPESKRSDPNSPPKGETAATAPSFAPASSAPNFSFGQQKTTTEAPKLAFGELNPSNKVATFSFGELKPQSEAKPFSFGEPKPFSFGEQKPAETSTQSPFGTGQRPLAPGSDQSPVLLGSPSEPKPFNLPSPPETKPAEAPAAELKPAGGPSEPKPFSFNGSQENAPKAFAFGQTTFGFGPESKGLPAPTEQQTFGFASSAEQKPFGVTSPTESKPFSLLNPAAASPSEPKPFTFNSAFSSTATQPAPHPKPFVFADPKPAEPPKPFSFTAPQAAFAFPPSDPKPFSFNAFGTTPINPKAFGMNEEKGEESSRKRMNNGLSEQPGASSQPAGFNPNPPAFSFNSQPQQQLQFNFPQQQQQQPFAFTTSSQPTPSNQPFPPFSFNSFSQPPSTDQQPPPPSSQSQNQPFVFGQSQPSEMTFSMGATPPGGRKISTPVTRRRPK